MNWFVLVGVFLEGLLHIVSVLILSFGMSDRSGGPAIAVMKEILPVALAWGAPHPPPYCEITLYANQTPEAEPQCNDSEDENEI